MQKADSDNDGHLKLHEVVKYIEDYCDECNASLFEGNPYEINIISLLQNFDKDHNGKLDLSELPDLFYEVDKKFGEHLAYNFNF